MVGPIGTYCTKEIYSYAKPLKLLVVISNQLLGFDDEFASMSVDPSLGTRQVLVETRPNN